MEEFKNELQVFMENVPEWEKKFALVWFLYGYLWSWKAVKWIKGIEWVDCDFYFLNNNDLRKRRKNCM